MRMKRVVRQIILLALVLMLVCVLHRAISGHRYTMFIQVPEGAAARRRGLFLSVLSVKAPKCGPFQAFLRLEKTVLMK